MHFNHDHQIHFISILVMKDLGTHTLFSIYYLHDHAQSALTRVVLVAGGFEQGKRLFDETCGHFPAPLIGCLKDVYIHMDTRPIQLSQAQAGANILSCDNR